MKSKKNIYATHDATFKQFLKLPAVARDFMEIHLPKELRSLCDFSTLKLENSSFVEEHLKQYFSDILYSLRVNDGTEGYIQVLIEHQSSPDKNMAFRMIRYAVAAMQNHLDAGNKKLPLVIPMLFYTGKRTPYPYSTNWLHSFSHPEIAKYIYHSDFPLIDITVIPDEDILMHRSMAALTLLQKHIHQRNLTVLLDKLVPLLLSKHLAPSQVVTLLNYIMQAGDTKDAKAFVCELALRVPQYEDELMTIAQQLERNGIEQGIHLGEQRGLEQGIQLGEQKEKRAVACSMLLHGIDYDMVMKVTGLTIEELVQLNH